jgi:hypothetical protein
MSEHCERGGILWVVAAVAVGVVLGGMALGAVFWALGLLIHLFVWFLRIAAIVGLAGLVLWLFEHRRSRALS